MYLFELLPDLPLKLNLLPLGLSAQSLDLFSVASTKFFDLGFVALFEVSVTVPKLLFPALGRPFKVFDLGFVALFQGRALLAELLP